MIWKIRKRERPILKAGELVEFAITMAIGCKDILHVEAPAIRISFCLLHALKRVIGFFFGLQYRNGQGLRHVTHLNTKQIIGAAMSFSPSAFGAGRLDGGGSFQSQPSIVIVAFVLQDRINQKEAGFGFIVAHVFLTPALVVEVILLDLQNALNCLSASFEGDVLAFSQRFTVAKLTPRAWARFSWLNPS
jgi:hypothetical protein